MWPLLLQDLQMNLSIGYNILHTRANSTYLNKGQIQLVDVCLLSAHSGLIRGDLHSDSNNEIPDTCLHW